VCNKKEEWSGKAVLPLTSKYRYSFPQFHLFSENHAPKVLSNEIDRFFVVHLSVRSPRTDKGRHHVVFFPSLVSASNPGKSDPYAESDASKHSSTSIGVKSISYCATLHSRLRLIACVIFSSKRSPSLYVRSRRLSNVELPD